MSTYISIRQWGNKDGETFGITLNAKSAVEDLEDYTEGEDTYAAKPVAAPAEYEVRVSSTTGSGNSVIFSAETTLTTELPTISNTFIKLADGFVENGVLQVIGTVDEENGKVNYELQKAFVLNGVDIKSFVDMDYDESDLDDTSASHYNWIPSEQSLSVNVWKTKEDFEDEDDWSAAEWNQLYVTRNLSANIYFFGNELNATTYDFKAVVKSAIYSTTPKSVITIDETELVSNYGGAAIDIKDAVTKAVYAAGPQKGQEYNLFEIAGSNKTSKDVTDYDSPKTSGTDPVYVLNAAGTPVEIAKSDLTKLGLSAADYINLGDKKFYMLMGTQTFGSSTIDGWDAIMDVVNKYYTYDNKGNWSLVKNPATGKTWTATEIAANGDDAYIALFNAYKEKMAFIVKKKYFANYTI